MNVGGGGGRNLRDCCRNGIGGEKKRSHRNYTQELGFAQVPHGHRYGDLLNPWSNSFTGLHPYKDSRS